MAIDDKISIMKYRRSSQPNFESIHIDDQNASRSIQGKKAFQTISSHRDSQPVPHKTN